MSNRDDGLEVEVAAIRYAGGDRGFRELVAFEEAFSLRESRGGAPEGVRWSPGGGWEDSWTPSSAGAHLLRRHLKNGALMAGAHEQPAVRQTPEDEREMLEYLRRMHQRDERLRDRIRSKAV